MDEGARLDVPDLQAPLSAGHDDLVEVGGWVDEAGRGEGGVKLDGCGELVGGDVPDEQLSAVGRDCAQVRVEEDGLSYMGVRVWV